MAEGSAARSGSDGPPARATSPKAEQPDRLIHERVRLGIMSALAANDELTFVEIKNTLQTTDGNVSVHARKLEQAGYIRCTKSFQDRVPRTAYAITSQGRRALNRYLDHMEALIRAVRDR